VGKFAVSDEAREMLSALEGPLSVVAVVGQYRTGKSFLLNRILLDLRGVSNGFSVGSTVRAASTPPLLIRGSRAVLPLEPAMETARTRMHTYTSKRTRKIRKCYHTRVERERERERERVILGERVIARFIRAKTRTYKQTHTCTQKQSPTYKPTRAHTRTR
jgi:hypothetical protein